MVYRAVRRAASVQILDNNIPRAAATATIRAINPREVIFDVHSMPASDSALMFCSHQLRQVASRTHQRHGEFDSNAPRGAHSVFQRTLCLVQKTMNVFSAMAIDQCHEQVNALIKSDGGAVCLVERQLMFVKDLLLYLLATFQSMVTPPHSLKIMEAC